LGSMDVGRTKATAVVTMPTKNTASLSSSRGTDPELRDAKELR
jgi:hypothetical protein